MTEASFKTAISQHNEESTYIRGYEITELMGKVNFTQQIWLLLKGELPNKGQEELLNAILVACSEHRINVPSVAAAMYSYSAGNTMNTAMAAGLMGIGDHHGGAIDNAMKFFYDNVDKDPEKLVKEIIEKKGRFAGFGHKIYTTDMRSVKLYEIAKKNGIEGKYMKFALAFETAIEKVKGKKLCMNVDGATAAVLCEMGMNYKIGKGLFAVARCAGIFAHLAEESENPAIFRAIPDEQVEYTGVKPRKIK